MYMVKKQFITIGILCILISYMHPRCFGWKIIFHPYAAPFGDIGVRVTDDDILCMEQ